jgi:uncharacterized membrane protein YcgQ (UPF0703/DUF1980 family)
VNGGLNMKKLNLENGDYFWIKFNVPFKVRGVVGSEVISDLLRFEKKKKYTDDVWLERRGEMCMEVTRFGGEKDIIFIKDIINIQKIEDPYV